MWQQAVSDPSATLQSSQPLIGQILTNKASDWLSRSLTAGLVSGATDRPSRRTDGSLVPATDWSTWWESCTHSPPENRPRKKVEIKMVCFRTSCWSTDATTSRWRMPWPSRCSSRSYLARCPQWWVRNIIKQSGNLENNLLLGTNVLSRWHLFVGPGMISIEIIRASVNWNHLNKNCNKLGWEFLPFLGRD